MNILKLVSITCYNYHIILNTEERWNDLEFCKYGYSYMDEILKIQ